ncbi:hypothetical protein MSAN_00205900 [Mycena sanguinolenta]|uniref:Uncharacterized protein n=1 Tax=Mycena sanguinolenta TaxID=230812 RepID=A0A8H6ZI76_9AGAR|nr:hypothetical protein MSAN_00205900 [Mycena sanguinolenta]
MQLPLATTHNARVTHAARAAPTCTSSATRWVLELRGCARDGGGGERNERMCMCVCRRRVRTRPDRRQNMSSEGQATDGDGMRRHREQSHRIFESGEDLFSRWDPQYEGKL